MTTTELVLFVAYIPLAAGYFWSFSALMKTHAIIRELLLENIRLTRDLVPELHPEDFTKTD